MEFVSKTQHYLKVKKPLLERQRRARINKCLDTLKVLVAEFQGDDAILRMDKAEMLEATITFMRSETANRVSKTSSKVEVEPIESFRYGYMNAVNEVSRVMAATNGMDVEVGKAVMTRLGSEFNRLLHCQIPADIAVKTKVEPKQKLRVGPETHFSSAPTSPASSGYHSDSDENNSMGSPDIKPVWRPW